MKRKDLTPGTVFKYEPWDELLFVVDDFHPAFDAEGRAYIARSLGERSAGPRLWDIEVHKVIWTPPGTEAPAAKPPILTTDKQARKETPMARGLVDYFPRALAAVSHVSFVANEQHNPGQPMHWSKGKSADHADCIMRHLVERGSVDDDKLLHSAKLAWRALALLETELEEKGA